jgi:hypothetical protein
MRKIYQRMHTCESPKYQVQVYEEVEQKYCSMCREMNYYINDSEYAQPKMIPLCKENLKQHLKTGKHWLRRYDLDYFR